ncbi:hypothetical protein C8R46DRAFT_374399 [Mycena filopes]|nr:hypothetical protein C8R46DRAFT_374399 [Mycena filopes]
MPTKQELKAKLAVAKASKQTKDKAKAKPASKKENKNPARAVPKKERSAPVVRWAKKDTHHLTDQLLTLIEESALYRQSFGFTKVSKGAVQTGGKKPPDLHAELATTMFIEPIDSIYTTDDLESLTSVIGNRISALKRTYRDNRTLIGETGQGLLDEDREAEIESGSNLENIWDSVQDKFPWYKRMHALLGPSPVVDRGALTHSQTDVDLSFLDKKVKKSRGADAESDGDDDSASVAISNWSKSDKDDIVSISSTSSPVRPAPSQTPKTPTPAVKPEPMQLSVPRSNKRKSVLDQVQDLASQDRVQRLKIAEVREREKTTRNKDKYDAKAALEMARLRHQ